MKKIIVPIDFSQQSEYAMKVAVSLAKKHGFEILALHMLELNQAMITSTEGYHPEQTVFLIKMAEKRFDEFLKKPFLNNDEDMTILTEFDGSGINIGIQIPFLKFIKSYPNCTT